MLIAFKSQLISEVLFLKATFAAASVNNPEPREEFKVFTAPLFPNKRSGPAVATKPVESISVSDPDISPLLSTTKMPFTFKVSLV